MNEILDLLPRLDFLDQKFLQSLLETNDRINEAKTSVIVSKHVVTILSDVSYEKHAVAKGIVLFGKKSAQKHLLRNFRIVWSHV